VPLNRRIITDGNDDRLCRIVHDTESSQAVVYELFRKFGLAHIQIDARCPEAFERFRGKRERRFDLRGGGRDFSALLLCHFSDSIFQALRRWLQHRLGA
jgi:hypothetical protein